MRTVKNLLIGAAAAVILLALLSVTLLNKQSRTMRMTGLMREGRLAMEAAKNARAYDEALGFYMEAIESYRLAISVNRRSVDAYIQLAKACIYVGATEDALYFLKVGMRNTGNHKRLREAHAELLGKMAAAAPGGEDNSQALSALAK